MFEASAPFLFFDYLRIPYRLAPETGRKEFAPDHPWATSEWLWWPDADGSGRRSLHWVNLDRTRAAYPRELVPGEYRLDSSPVFGHVATNSWSSEWIRAAGGRWVPRAPVTDPHGGQVGSIWQDQDGSIFLPFDPGELIESFWSERYQDLRGAAALAHAKGVLTGTYYLARPLLPRSVQIQARRWFSRVQARSRFPRWPIETALHELYSQLFQLVAELARTPVPWLSPWPNGCSWAFVLTHDVETAAGYRNIGQVRDAELASGYRSSWNFVPRRYPIEEKLLEELAGQGFEIGVHGLYHDGRDLESSRILEKRLPAMRSYAQRWGAVGFRAPSTQRAWDLMAGLGFDYDTSYPDTDPFEPQSGGCCTWLPYFNRDIVELPITLVQDHTLFVILQRGDEQVWLQKAEHLRSRGGMVLALTHPDYLGQRSTLNSYRRMLRWAQEDDTAWRALPREVSAWWRRRSASSLELRDKAWRVIGPAAGEADVLFAPMRQPTWSVKVQGAR